MTQFTFYELYKDVMEMLDDDATRGQFMKAICKFMFEEEPVKPPKGNKSETDFSMRRNKDKKQKANIKKS